MTKAKTNRVVLSEGKMKKTESVAERAVRAYMCGHVHGTRTIESSSWFNCETRGWPAGVYASVSVFVPQKSIDTMLRRERAQKREKASAKNDPGGYIGEALSSIGDQKRAGKKKTKGAKR